MEINQERLDEIKIELAERHQLPHEEVSKIIENAIRGMTAMADGFKSLAEEMGRIWSSLKEIFQENYEKALWSENEAMYGWDLVWDTRRSSQVMSNKPKFMVRKIIR